MKLIAFQDGDRRMMACVDEGRALPFGSLEDFWADVASGVSAAREAGSRGLPLNELTLVPPVPETARVLCAGLNYAAHLEETRQEAPTQPDVFARWRSTLAVDGQPVPVPPRDPRLDWEGELAVIVGEELRNVSAEVARAGFLGYACFNDLSARGYQLASDRWALGKNADLSGPLGPWIVTADELEDPGRLRIRTRVNGKLVQDGNTSRLLFPGAEIAAYASGVMTLKPGDVIATGTPEGVGLARNPPTFLQPGDTVEVEIEGVGRLTNPIVACQRPTAV